MKQQLLDRLESLINTHRQQAQNERVQASTGGTNSIAQQGRHRVEAGKHEFAVDVLYKLLLEVEGMAE